MDLKQLQYFVAILDEGGVRRASEVVRVSQPALTVSLKNLETELGVRLFVRSGRRMQPTREGYHFYRRARALLAQAEAARAEMAAITSLEKAKVKLAAPAMIANYILRKPIARLMARHPGISVSLRQLAGPAVESALLAREVEIGFLSRPPRTAELTARLFARTALRALVRRTHPLAGAKAITWPQLFDYPVATLPERYLIHESILEKAAHHGVVADMAFETDVMALLIDFLRGSDAVGVMLDRAADHHDDLVSLRIEDPDTDVSAADAATRVFICHLRGEPLSLAADAVFKEIVSGE